MKKTLGIGLVTVAIALAVWFAYTNNWFLRNGPNNLPTAEERARMAEIDEISASIAPDAKPGVGVVPVGSKPVTPPPTLSATSTDVASSSDEEVANSSRSVDDSSGE